jgi:hypothetical protein
MQEHLLCVLTELIQYIGSAYVLIMYLLYARLIMSSMLTIEILSHSIY